MKTHSFSRALTAAVFGAVLFASAPPATAQDPNEPDDAIRECVTGCRDSERDCRFDGREAVKLCLEEAGCNTLADDYRATCLVADRDDEACSAARDALRECRAPCRDDAQTGNEECRTAFQTCALEECGIDAPPHRGGRHHGRRPGGRGPRR